MVPDHMNLTQSTHSNLSCSRQQSWAGSLLLRKRASDTIHNTLANWSTGLYTISLPRQPLKQWRQSEPSIEGRLLGLPSSYLWHAIGMFNTCSQGPTHRSLTNTSGGYNLGGADFPHLTPRPFHLTVLRFPPKGPTQSQVIQSQHKPQVKVMWNTYRWPMVFRPLDIYQSLYLRLAITNVFQILARSSRVTWKVSIMQLRF
jgi:hypothetical protein